MSFLLGLPIFRGYVKFPAVPTIIPFRSPKTCLARRRCHPFHPPGAELEDLQEGDVFEGTVTNVGRYGVFVDVGAAPRLKWWDPNPLLKWWVSGGKEVKQTSGVQLMFGWNSL